METFFLLLLGFVGFIGSLVCYGDWIAKRAAQYVVKELRKDG